jgi:hypothetical protein
MEREAKGRSTSTEISTKEEQKSRKPKCDQCATSQHSHGFLAHGHAGPRGCKKRFLGEAACRTLTLRLFARERDKKKKKASVREKELESKKSQKAPASLCCAPESRSKCHRSSKARPER